MSGHYAFQRLRQTWFTPRVVPKFKFVPDDKFYAVGCVSPVELNTHSLGAELPLRA